VIAPWLDVESDDVIFDYIKGLTDGLAPARAEDAESELARRTRRSSAPVGPPSSTGRMKDRYSASDVSRYREALLIAEATPRSPSRCRFTSWPHDRGLRRSVLARDDPAAPEASWTTESSG
jgi:hypothetical protein